MDGEIIELFQNYYRITGRLESLQRSFTGKLLESNCLREVVPPPPGVPGRNTKRVESAVGFSNLVCVVYEVKAERNSMFLEIRNMSLCALLCERSGIAAGAVDKGWGSH